MGRAFRHDSLDVGPRAVASITLASREFRRAVASSRATKQNIGILAKVG
jgi:hypothetical protein